MKILFIANYVDFPWESGNCRFFYLINRLFKNNIELITSNFCHTSKKKRFLNKGIENNNFKITLINELGYKKNVSIKRVFSHKKLSNNLKKYLKNLDYIPDVIYCSIPSIAFAYESSKR